MGIAYTPEIYKSLGAKVSIDLGSLADIGVVKEGVTTLQTSTNRIESAAVTNQAATIDRVVGAENTLKTAIGANDTLLRERFDATDEAFTKAENNAKQRHEDLLKAITAIEIDDDDPVLAENAIAYLAPLLKLQDQVLCKGFADPRLVETTVKQLQGLSEDGAVLAAALSAAVAGTDTGWAERTRRFWALSDLVDDVAEALDG